jgi:hypothetical protein
LIEIKKNEKVEDEATVPNRLCCLVEQKGTACIKIAGPNLSGFKSQLGYMLDGPSDNSLCQ